MFKDKELIARLDQSLQEHLEEVSKLSSEFASKIGLKKYGEIIGLLHDIGKASSDFQQYIKSAVGLIDSDEEDYINSSELKGKIDHSTAGAQLVYKTLMKNPGEKFIAQILSLCIASHHSGLIDCISPDGVDLFSKRMNKSDERTHLNEVLNINDEQIINSISFLQSEEFKSDLLIYFKSLKIEKQDSVQTLTFKWGLLIRFLFSCLLDADRLNTADSEHPQKAKFRLNGVYVKWIDLCKRFNKKLSELENVSGINIIRQKISNTCYEFSNQPKGLYQLTVPTGGGKTFASLRFALNHADKYHMDRIIYVLPFTTIIEQNAEEIRKILEDVDENGNYLGDVVLEHHSNLLPENETAKQKLLSENWDAPVVLTTSVQILEALFGAGTRGARRMHQLANAVIIFDEVQAIPVRCVHMFNSAVSFLVNNCGSTVILCTATQPLLDRIEPKSRALQINEKQQIILNARQLFSDLKRVQLCDDRKIGGWSTEEISELAIKQVTDSGNVLIVVNTKKSAQEIYKKCKLMSNIELYHLSTYMCPAHRLYALNKIKSCLQDKKKVVCISTQLIEAGVDISFASVIRFMTGFDSILQAAGRCNRHNDYFPKLGKVSIINPSEEKIDSLEDIKIGGEKTERLLDEFKKDPDKFDNDLLSPKTIEQYYQYYFFQRKDEMNYPVKSSSGVDRNDNLYELLSTNQNSVQEYQRINNSHPNIAIRQAFMTASKAFQAIETFSKGIVIPYGKDGKEIINDLCSKFELNKQYKLLHKAQRYSVNVYPNIFNKLLENGIIREVQKGSEIYYLDEKYYSDEYGLSLIAIKDDEFLNG
ncbi:MAG: hypothetical protein ACD_79C01434G0011 [uncultured bacterium]|nr:MAG: hypothetical protein ACD_79C01434G0011 [uncultured bacterium]